MSVIRNSNLGVHKLWAALPHSMYLRPSPVGTHAEDPIRDQLIASLGPQVKIERDARSGTSVLVNEASGWYLGSGVILVRDREIIAFINLLLGAAIDRVHVAEGLP